MGKTENLKPWKPGQSGNPGGRPKTKPVTEELERLLQEQAPEANGKTWAAVIAETLLKQARKGDVRAIAELVNRIEGKPAVTIKADGNEGLRLYVIRHSIPRPENGGDKAER